VRFSRARAPQSPPGAAGPPPAMPPMHGRRLRWRGEEWQWCHSTHDSAIDCSARPLAGAHCTTAAAASVSPTAAAPATSRPVRGAADDKHNLRECREPRWVIFSDAGIRKCPYGRELRVFGEQITKVLTSSTFVRARQVTKRRFTSIIQLLGTQRSVVTTPASP
jgi:hypothetical protein